MKKEDRVFLGLLILSNILGFIFLYYSTVEDLSSTIENKQINIDDSIRKHIDDGYIFNHSQIK